MGRVSTLVLVAALVSLPLVAVRPSGWSWVAGPVTAAGLWLLQRAAREERREAQAPAPVD